MPGCRAYLSRITLLLGLASLGWWLGGTGQEGLPRVARLRVQGTIGPASASYIARGIREAAAQGCQCLVIELDTPGGLLDSTREITQSFLRSPVPTVVFVSPPGAWAGSAGCFITMAADYAAMAPGTSIGAAHPVGLTPGGEKPDETMAKKLENFSSSYIEAIAAERHRNTEWAKASVRNSEAIPAEKALALNVIDLVAKDLPDLLAQVDGRTWNGRTLRTARAPLLDIPMTLRERVFQTLAHPQVMLVLMLIVMYGVIGEMTSPGAILPGVTGVIALFLLLYLGSVLPMSMAGLALVGLAIALFVIDAFTPTHGVLTAGGVVAFFLGCLMLFDRSEPYLRLSLAWVVPSTVLTALFFSFIVGAGLQAQRRPTRTAKAGLEGRRTTALGPIDAQGGRVFIEGEYWTARSPSPVAAGQSVDIIAVEGLTLKVVPSAASEENRP